jgi:hypothetical protein
MVIVEESAENQQIETEEIPAANLETQSVRHAEKVDTAAPPSAPTAPQPEVPEYVFVRRDGGLLFAVAYSWDRGMLRYVTREGFRKSVLRDALDLEATRRFNEQRGLSFN